MKIYQSIFKRGKDGGDIGRIQNPWTLRLTAIDEQENKTSKTWQYATKQDAKDDVENRKAELLVLMDSKGRDMGDVKTFRQWAEYAKRDFYRPAIISEGRKVAGIKAHRQTHILIDQLIECFADKPLAKFTKHDLDRYKVWRLEQGDRRGEKGKLGPKERNAIRISTANRGLAIFKHLLNEAHDAGLIAKNVTKGSKAIDTDAETAKTRTLTEREETLLLASCGGTRSVTYDRKGKPVTATVTLDNPHLKAVILLGLDAGLRRNEVLTLDWRDVDFDGGYIRVQSRHTKTQKNRNVPLRDRVKAELMALPNFGTTGKIFPFSDFKRSWATALRIAGIDGLTYHDLRRTFVTRLSVKGVPLSVAGKLAGHSTLATTQKHYVSTDDLAIIEDVRARLDAPATVQAAREFVN